MEGVMYTVRIGDRNREQFMNRRLGQGGVYAQETGIGWGSCTGYRDREGFMFRRQGQGVVYVQEKTGEKGGVYVQETG